MTNKKLLESSATRLIQKILKFAKCEVTVKFCVLMSNINKNQFS